MKINNSCILEEWVINQPRLLEQIFSDAHLVDIDMSGWDKYIGLYVFADHVDRTVRGGKRLFLIELVRVQSIEITFNHLSNDYIATLGPEEHVQWQLDEFKFETDGQRVTVSLSGLPSSPRMTASCESIEIQEVAESTLDLLPAWWIRPSAGFIRPALARMAEDFGRH
jgi:hypothetical protein